MCPILNCKDKGGGGGGGGELRRELSYMFQEIYKRIGFNLLKQRRLKGWTQEQLAEKSGVSRSRISKMENGKENFNIESLFLIAQSLEIDFIELLK